MSKTLCQRPRPDCGASYSGRNCRQMVFLMQYPDSDEWYNLILDKKVEHQDEIEE